MPLKKISFRGKNVTTMEWVFGSLIAYTSGVCVICQIRESFKQEWCIGVIPESVGRFTNIIDHQNNEIYFGDLRKYNGKIYQVVMDYNKIILQRTMVFFWRKFRN